MNKHDFEVTQTMLAYGGAFVRRLAEAARVADRDNLAKIKTCFSDYWCKYAAMAEQLDEEGN